MKKLALLALLVAATPAAAQNTMSFFITSAGPGDGAKLGGLAGADAHCKQLADASGVTGKTWRAYLSAKAGGGQPAANAKDRIGPGPWYNQKGVKVAENVADLHSDNNKLGKENSLTEKGAEVPGRGNSPNHHDIITGSLMNGTLSPDTTRHDLQQLDLERHGCGLRWPSRPPGWRREPDFMELGPPFSRLLPAEPRGHGWERLFLLLRHQLRSELKCPSRSRSTASPPRSMSRPTPHCSGSFVIRST